MEYLGLQIFHSVDPDTLERRDFMLAQIAATDAQVNGNKLKTTDMMPWHKAEPMEQKALEKKILHTFGLIAAGFEAAEEANKKRG